MTSASYKGRARTILLNRYLTTYVSRINLGRMAIIVSMYGATSRSLFSMERGGVIRLPFLLIVGGRDTCEVFSYGCVAMLRYYFGVSIPIVTTIYRFGLIRVEETNGRLICGRFLDLEITAHNIMSQQAMIARLYESTNGIGACRDPYTRTPNSRVRILVRISLKLCLNNVCDPMSLLVRRGMEISII